MTQDRAARAGVAAWGLALFAGCRAIQIFLEAQSMAAAVGQVVLVEWGTSRLGIGWSSTPVTAALIARRIALGVGFGAVAALAVFASLMATRAATVEPVSSIEASVLALGLVTAALLAWRDELLLHGLTLRALSGSGGAEISPIARALACGVTSAGAALGRSDATARSVFVAALLGVGLGTLWLRDRGAWQPWAAHTTIRFATGTLLSGGLVHSRLADNSWAGGGAGMLGGGAAAVALVPFAVLALGWAARTSSPRSAPVG